MIDLLDVLVILAILAIVYDKCVYETLGGIMALGLMAYAGWYEFVWMMFLFYIYKPPRYTTDDKNRRGVNEPNWLNRFIDAYLHTSILLKMLIQWIPTKLTCRGNAVNCAYLPSQTHSSTLEYFMVDMLMCIAWAILFVICKSKLRPTWQFVCPFMCGGAMLLHVVGFIAFASYI